MLLAIVVLTTPLRATGEEFGSHGPLTRAAGSWVADPRVALVLGTLVSAVLFTVVHGAGDPWLVTYSFGSDLNQTFNRQNGRARR